MIKILLLLLLSVSVSASVCELAFLKNYHKNAEGLLEKLRSQSFKKLKQKILESKDIREKFDLIEAEYNLISDITEKQEEIVKTLIKSQNLDQKQIEALYKEVYLEIISTHKEHVNFIINQSKMMLEAAGVKVNIKYRYYSKDVRVKYLEVAKNEAGDSKANKLLLKYMKAMNTKEVTFDFFENMQNGSAGFSVATTRRIDLGIRGVRNIVLDNLITMVGKHEFKHGGFARMRAQGIDSIYHPQYHSLNGKPMTKIDTGVYNTFMSSEEMYNFVNNPYWANARIKNIDKFLQKDYFNDVGGISYYINATTGILKQSDELATHFIKLLTKSNIKKQDKIAIHFMNADMQFVHDIDLVTQIAIADPKTGKMMVDFVTKEMIEDIKKILQVRFDLRVKYSNRIQALGEQTPESVAKFNKIMVRFHNEEVELSRASYDSIIDKLVHKQTLLQAVSKRMLKENDRLIKETNQFIEDVRYARDELNVDFSKSPEWIERFNQMAIKYQDLGKLVREDYKGFIAVDLK